jgi:hypothetical protein
MLKWSLIALAACAMYAVARLWPLLWAITSSNPVTRMKRMLASAGRCYNNGKSRRAVELAGWGLWFAPEPDEAHDAEARRLGSDLAAAHSIAYGRLNMFQLAQMMATNSVLRDRANPLAYEALGLSLACNGHTDEARTQFLEGLRVARESQPVDTEAEERINRQLLWLNKQASTINKLYDTAEGYPPRA